MATAYKSQLRALALVAFVLALVSAGLGGWADMTGKPLIISKEHGWSDSILMMLAAIFLLLLSFF